MHIFVPPSMHLFFHHSIHSFIHSFMPILVHSFTHQFVHSFMHIPVHLCIPKLNSYMLQRDNLAIQCRVTIQENLRSLQANIHMSHPLIGVATVQTLNSCTSRPVVCQCLVVTTLMDNISKKVSQVHQ